MSAKEMGGGFWMAIGEEFLETAFSGWMNSGEAESDRLSMEMRWATAAVGSSAPYMTARFNYTTWWSAAMLS